MMVESISNRKTTFKESLLRLAIVVFVTEHHFTTTRAFSSSGFSSEIGFYYTSSLCLEGLDIIPEP